MYKLAEFQYKDSVEDRSLRRQAILILNDTVSNLFNLNLFSCLVSGVTCVDILQMLLLNW